MLRNRVVASRSVATGRRIYYVAYSPVEADMWFVSSRLLAISDLICIFMITIFLYLSTPTSLKLALSSALP